MLTGIAVNKVKTVSDFQLACNLRKDPNPDPKPDPDLNQQNGKSDPDRHQKRC